MAVHEHYTICQEELKKEYDTLLTCTQAEFIANKLVRRFKLDRPDWSNMYERINGIKYKRLPCGLLLQFHGNGKNFTGNCRPEMLWVKVCHNPSLGLLIQELANLPSTPSKISGKARRGFTRQHLYIMKRMARYCEYKKYWGLKIG